MTELRNGIADTSDSPSAPDGRFGARHKSFLLAAGPAGQQHFRPLVFAARLGLTIAEGKLVMQELMEMGFFQRQWNRTHDDSPYCVLTEDGQVEVERLWRLAPGPVTLPELTEEVARLRSEVARLTTEAGLLNADDERLYRENKRLKDENVRLRKRVLAFANVNAEKFQCRRCKGQVTQNAVYCPRCGEKQVGASPIGRARPAQPAGTDGR